MEGLNQVLFRIVEDDKNGRHLIAIRDIKAGELIFTESPTVYSPGQHEDTCLVCLKSSRGRTCTHCWWPVCSDTCQQSSVHKQECRYLTTCLASGSEEDASLPIRHILALRCLLLKNNTPRAWERLVRLRGHHGQQGIERSDEENIADFGYRDLAVFIWNDCGLTNITPEDVALVYNLVANSTMSIMVHGAEFQGIYLTAALLTQSCVQNTRCVYKGRDNKLFLYASTNISKGDRLCHSWIKNLLQTNTSHRQKLLRDVFLQCHCTRCQDPTELGTFESGVKCQKCEGIILPTNPLTANTEWKCDSCNSDFSSNFINTLMISVQEDQEDDLKDFEEKTSCILFPNHSFLIEEKLKSFLNSCNSDKIEDRIYLGRELLSIADKLEPGFSVIREKILLQLGFSLQEFVGFMLMEFLSSDEDPSLKERHIIINESLKDASHYLMEALSCTRLEEALDGSKETSAKDIKECLQIIQEMRNHYELQMTKQ